MVLESSSKPDDLIGSVDLQGNISFINQAAKRIYGYQPEAMIGRPFADFISPEQAEKDLKVFRGVLETGSLSQYITKHRRKDGSDVWLSFNSTVLRDDQGMIMGMMGTGTDITAKIKAENDLRDSQALYHSLVQNLPQHIFRKNLQGQFIYANANFCKLMGKEHSEVIGKTDFDLCPAGLAAKYQRDDQWVLTHREMVETVERHELSAGTVTYAQVVRTPIYDGGGMLTGIQGIFWDITERKISEEHGLFDY